MDTETGSRRELEGGMSQEGESVSLESGRTGLEAKTRQLLGRGEDLLRAGRYQQAVHVLTKILFLDRGNPDARKLIGRAKVAIAENHRQLDLIVMEAAGHLEQGKRQRARREVENVLAIDPRHTEARNLLETLDALERRGEARSCSVSTSAPPGSLRPDTGRRPRRRRGTVKPGEPSKSNKRGAGSSVKIGAFVFLVSCVFGMGGLYLHLNWDFLISDRGVSASRQAGPAVVEESDRLPLLLPSELYFYNGVRLYGEGRYREALAELGRVERRSSVYEEARKLILRIEERLLRGAVGVERADPGGGSG